MINICAKCGESMIYVEGNSFTHSGWHCKCGNWDYSVSQWSGTALEKKEALKELRGIPECFSYKKLREALELAITALLGPQPDPNTGLVSCGCGGKAILTEYKYSLYVPLEPPHWAVCCENHCVRNIKGIGREEVIRIWNTAMGWREDE